MHGPAEASSPREQAGSVPLLVALAGNPNTGKTTLFNALTGLRQHTGNWPGKTVVQARGTYRHHDRPYLLVDLPGTYSLLANSPEEEVARDFLCFDQPAATVVVLDATNLERNLNLALQVMEITPRVVLCVNLVDEAERKGLSVDVAALARETGVPAVATAAREGKGLPELLDAVEAIALGKISPRPRPVSYGEATEQAVHRLQPSLQDLSRFGLNPRWVALRILEGDEKFLALLERFTARPLPGTGKEVQLWR